MQYGIILGGFREKEKPWLLWERVSWDEYRGMSSQWMKRMHPYIYIYIYVIYVIRRAGLGSPSFSMLNQPTLAMNDKGHR